MILLAESGATRSHWALVSSNWSSEVVTLRGFNPNYHQHSAFPDLIIELIKALPESTKVSEIVFYGSGCAGKQRAADVGQMLARLFPKTNVQVHGDLLAAARGLFGTQAGLAVILGTGSNAGLYNGNEIVRTIPSLGYIMGDEGSGSHLGKLLVKAFVTRRMPDAIADDFMHFTGLSYDDIVRAIYSHPEPGNLLASFAPFLSKYKTEEFCERLVIESFTSFFSFLKPMLPEVALPEISATGSVAANFSAQFIKTAETSGFKVHRVLSSPFPDLLAYHRKLLSE